MKIREDYTENMRKSMLYGKLLLLRHKPLNLFLVEVGICSRFCKELFMRTVLDNPTSFEDDDSVHVLEGREPVSNGDDGFAFHDTMKSILNQLFALAVECAGRLVEQENRRGFQDGTSNSDALALSSGEFDPAFSNLGIVSLGHGGDEFVRMGELRSSNHVLSRGVRRPIGDIIEERPVEEHRILRNHRNSAPEGIL